jgi:hypothetical protein
MKRKIKKIIKALCIIIPIILIGLFIMGYDMAHQSAKLISCTNHILQLKMMFAQLPGNNLEDAGHYQYNQLPYDKNVPGYALLPPIWPNYKKNAMRRGLDCNHGGWQMLNLPREQMIKLIKTWEKHYIELPPYLWCGRPTGKDLRVALKVGYDKDDNKFTLFFRDIQKLDIEKLNKCLKEIEEEPISINIPDDIDWAKYIKEKNENEVVSPNSDSAVAKPE